MSRSMMLLAGLLACGLGCQHTAGRCDCQPIVQPCHKYGLYNFDVNAVAPPSPPLIDASKSKQAQSMKPAAPISLDGGF